MFDNFPVRIAARLVQYICFPLGRPFKKPSDTLKQELGEMIMQNNPFRDELKKHVFYNTEADDVTGRMESTFQMLLSIEPLWNQFKKAESKGQFNGLTFEERLADAVANHAVTEDEAAKLTIYNAKRFDSMLTDIFDLKLDQNLALDNPHQPLPK